MKTTRIALAALILAAIGFEIYALISPDVWTISRYFWSEGPDKFMVGAPIIALLGFICGHLVWPSNKKTARTRIRLGLIVRGRVRAVEGTLRLVLIIAWMAYEAVVWAFLPEWQWTTSRMVFRWFSWMGVQGVDVFAVHFFAGHYFWTRGLVKNE